MINFNFNILSYLNKFRCCLCIHNLTFPYFLLSSYGIPCSVNEHYFEVVLLSLLLFDLKSIVLVMSQIDCNADSIVIWVVGGISMYSWFLFYFQSSSEVEMVNDSSLYMGSFLHKLRESKIFKKFCHPIISSCSIAYVEVSAYNCSYLGFNNII